LSTELSYQTGSAEVMENGMFMKFLFVTQPELLHAV
jgi:hypothetical protein